MSDTQYDSLTAATDAATVWKRLIQLSGVAAPPCGIKTRFETDYKVTSPLQEAVMHRCSVSVFYKQQPERPTLDQLLFPERLQSGDRYTRVFKGEIEFSNVPDDNVLDELFATFNGHGKPLPPNTNIPRSICVGDIIVTAEETQAFLVTATGFERLPFSPRDEKFEITQPLSRQLASIPWRTLYAL